jgi:methylated-DNA-protein-cysteine methyltransferase related protein
MQDTPDYALYDKIYTVAEQIPYGKVATYGDIATIVGGGCDARTVGYALNEMPPDRANVPWQRIINRQGGISTRGLSQRKLLEDEGV